MDEPQRENRWVVEVDRLDVEIRALRHRMNNMEQITANLSNIHSLSVKAIDEDLGSLKATVYGNGQPGLKLDVDRLKQRSLASGESRLLHIAAWGTIGTLVAAIAAVTALVMK